MKQGDREADVLEARNKLRKEENKVEGGRQRFFQADQAAEQTFPAGKPRAGSQAHQGEIA